MQIVFQKTNVGFELVESNIDSVEKVFETEKAIYFIDANQTEWSNIHERLGKEEACPDYHFFEKLLSGNLFVVSYDKQKKTVFVMRDRSGVKSGYYSIKDNKCFIGTNVHLLAKKCETTSFNSSIIYRFLYSDFLLDGQTFYDGVHEFKRGGSYVLDSNMLFHCVASYEIEFAKGDNKLSNESNIKKLRKQISEAHAPFISEDNVVLLSGGIDSVAILIGLDDLVEKDCIRALSYKVKGTTQDETFYAKSIADHLNIPIEIIEIDPKDKQNFENLDKRLVSMNNPYIGMWIFGNFTGSNNDMFYAGQDTRLHTPSVNIVDQFAFRFLKYNSSSLVSVLSSFGSLVRKCLGLFNEKNRIVKNLIKLSYIFNIKDYVEKFYFNIDQKRFIKMGFPSDVLKDIEKYFSLNYKEIKNPRDLYNKIVNLKWSEQYVNDIRYMQDCAKVKETYMAMPFYSEEFSKFSSSIPFKLAIQNMVGRGRYSNKKRVVNKYVLRQALRDKMNDTVYYRAKAVSSTMHLLFLGELGNIISGDFRNDLKSTDSFINEFQLKSFVDRFLNERECIGMQDELYLLKVYHIWILIKYRQLVLLRS